MKTAMKIAIVTSDIMGPIRNGGVGTSCYLLAKGLSQSGHDVHILFSGGYMEKETSFLYWQYYYKDFGVTLDKVKHPPIHLQHGNYYACASMSVYLQMREADFDLIIFPEMHGLGHYCLLAKKSGLEFQNTQLWVMFNGPSAWHLVGNDGLPSSLPELAMHSMEKDSCLNADLVIFATDHAREVALEMKFITPDQPTEVVLYPFEEGPSQPKSTEKKLKEICFFGRLETRKGLETFLEAVSKIRPILQKHQIKISVLGGPGTINGVKATEYIKKWVEEEKIYVEMLEGRNREECLKYLRDAQAMVVLPSRSETMGYTMLECLENHVPFVCSDIPPFLELIKLFKAKDALVAKVEDVDDWADKMQQAIRRGLKPTPRRSGVAQETTKKWNQLVSQAFSAQAPKKVVKNKMRGHAKISLCIPHHNRPHFFKQITDVLVTMKTLPEEILVYDDVSDSKSLAELKKVIKEFKPVPIKLIEGRQRQGPSGSRNRLSEAASGEYLFFLDDDNLPVESLFHDLQVIIRHQNPDFIVSSLERFASEGAGQNMFQTQTFNDLWFPITTDLSTNFFHNMIGDANFCVNKAFYQKVGGFDKDLESSEDLEFFIRAILAKGKALLCPKTLVQYRSHQHNASAKHNPHRSMVALQKKLVGNLFHPDLKGLMQMTTAWAYARENIFARGAMPTFRPIVKTPLPLQKLMERDRKTMKAIQDAWMGESDMNDYALKVVTTKNFKNLARSGLKEETLNVMILSPKTLEFQAEPDGPKLKIFPGINIVDLRLTSKHGLLLVAEEEEVELFVIQARPPSRKAKNERSISLTDSKDQ